MSSHSILYINLSYKDYKNKANAQMEAFRKIGYKTYIGFVEKNSECVKQSISMVTDDSILSPLFERKYITTSLKRKTRTYLFTVFQVFYDWALSNDIDVIYVRRLGQRAFFSGKFFKRCHNNQKLKVIYEIPTYPIDSSDNKKDNIWQYFEEKYYTHKIEPYVDVVPVCLQSLCELPAKYLPFSNGVEYAKYKSSSTVEFDHTLVCVAFAHAMYWHGYERMIRGIKEYRGSYRVEFHLYSAVNDTVDNLKKIVSELKLEGSVFFHDEIPIADMVKVAGNSHVGIGGLSYHKKGATIDTAIKNKEYAALGLPFIYTLPDLAFPEEWPYHLKFSADEAPINIEKIIEWYCKLPANYKEQMYQYAEGNLGFESEVNHINNKLFKSIKEIT